MNSQTENDPLQQLANETKPGEWILVLDWEKTYELDLFFRMGIRLKSHMRADKDFRLMSLQKNHFRSVLWECGNSHYELNFKMEEMQRIFIMIHQALLEKGTLYLGFTNDEIGKRSHASSKPLLSLLKQSGFSLQGFYDQTDSVKNRSIWVFTK